MGEDLLCNYCQGAQDLYYSEQGILTDQEREFISREPCPSCYGTGFMKHIPLYPSAEHFKTALEAAVRAIKKFSAKR